MTDGWGGLDREAVSFAAHRGLRYSGPYGDPAVAEVLAAAALPEGARVVDIGCGDGEMLLQLLAAVPGATGLGVDPGTRGLALARTRAAARGLAERSTFVAAKAEDAELEAAAHDLVICVGATHAFGGTEAALAGCRGLTRLGGLALLGEGFWERPPTPEALTALQAEPAGYGDLAALRDMAGDHGFTVVHTRASTQQEWDGYEDTWTANIEDQAGDLDADAADVRRFAARRRAQYRDGYRGILGFALLLLRLAAGRGPR